MIRPSYPTTPRLRRAAADVKRILDSEYPGFARPLHRRVATRIARKLLTEAFFSALPTELDDRRFCPDCERRVDSDYRRHPSFGPNVKHMACADCGVTTLPRRPNGRGSR